MTELTPFLVGTVAGFAFIIGLVAVCATRDESYEIQVAERLERFVRREWRA